MTDQLLPVASSEDEFSEDSALREIKRAGRSRVVLLSVVMPLLVLGSVILALTAGRNGHSLAEIFQVVHLQIFGGEVDDATFTLVDVIWGIKFPRVLMALLAGAVLSLAGVVMQGLLRNPLVSEYTLGLSPAAAFGASLVIVISASNGSGYTSGVVGSALAFALSTSLIVLALAGTKRMSVTVLILLGIAITQLFSALTAAVQFFANEQALAAITRWTFGSVNNANWQEILIIGAAFLVVFPFFLARSTAMNVIAFAGDDMAKSLGVNVGLTRVLLIFAAVAASSFVVSFAGVIGFVGLVAPHISRFLIGSDHRYLLPFSAAIGAALVVLADTAGRVLLEPRVIPVGIVISLIGAPLFIYLILKNRGRA